MRKFLGFAMLALLVCAAMGAEENGFQVVSEPRQEIPFPDILGYQTLVCDFHTHTVFSDGNVWPTVRVDEAWREGLDVVVVTDHIEYQPHSKDLPTNHNRPYDLVNPVARVKNILLPKGTEITRSTPPGHFNAIFLENIDSVSTTEFVDAVKNANEQGGFVFWNHHAWKGPELGNWREVHTTLYENKWLHGMEVANGDDYYYDAHAWCLEKGLTMLGNSDIHAPSMLEKSTPEKHRTSTLVFVKEYSLDGVHEALREGRTAVWINQDLIGKPEYLDALFRESVKIGKPYLKRENTYYLDVKNEAFIEFLLVSPDKKELLLPAMKTTQIQVKAAAGQTQVELPFEVENLRVAPKEGLKVKLTVELGM